MAERYQYPFEVRFEEIDGVRIHYVGEGAGPPILMVHGRPTWSYLYRKMIPPLVAAGYRYIAPDLMGFGLSDKPSDEPEYSLKRHVDIVTGLADRVELVDLNVVVQDWGRPTGLRYAIEHQTNLNALIILNTLVCAIKVPWLFKVIFLSGSFSSFLVRRFDLLRMMSFSGSLAFKRPLDRRAKEQ